MFLSSRQLRIWLGGLVLAVASVVGARNDGSMMNIRSTHFPNRLLEYGAPETVGMSSERLALLDGVVRDAIDARETSGAVVLIARRGKIVYERAFGYRAVVPEKEAMTTDTIFDLASLTKCVATASAVMKLVEDGKLRLGDPVKKFIPDWTASKEEKAYQTELGKVRRWIRAGVLQVAPEMQVSQHLETTQSKRLVTGRENPREVWERLVRKGVLKLPQRALEEQLTLAVPDREAVTLRHLLTHTSGLDPYDNYYLKFPQGNARQQIIQDIARRPLLAPAGEAFVYSDLGYITLGEIVERVSGTDLNTFCRKTLYEPLGMHDTMFNPPKSLLPRIAPTEWRVRPEPQAKQQKSGEAPQPQKYMIRGEVHDGNAFVQNGISGHAGLFSTAHDLAIFAQMMLNGGQYGNVRIFSPLTVRAMISDQARLKDGTKRGYGWDIASGYSSQRGDIFTTGFGHTGWTGTSLWAVPEEELIIIVLTSRCHPDGTGDVGPLRAKIANVVASSIVEPNATDSELKHGEEKQ